MSKSKFRAEVIDLILSQPDEFISTDIALHPKVMAGTANHYKYAGDLVRELRDEGYLIWIGKQPGRGKKRKANTYVVRGREYVSSLRAEVSSMSTDRLLEVYRVVSDALVKRVPA